MRAPREPSSVTPGQGDSPAGVELVRLDRAIAFHASTLRAEGRKQATLDNYATAQRLYARWVADVLGSDPPTVADLTLANVRAFLLWLEEEHRSPRKGGTVVGHGPESLRFYARILKMWSGFLARELPGVTDRLATLKLPKVPRKELPVLTREEFALLVRLAATTKEPLRNM